MQAAHVRINFGKDRPVVALFLMRNYQRLVMHFFRMYKVFFGKRIIFRGGIFYLLFQERSL